MPQIAEFGIEDDIAGAERNKLEAGHVDPVAVEPYPHIAHTITY